MAYSDPDPLIISLQINDTNTQINSQRCLDVINKEYLSILHL